jgi:hypothetical protein
MRAVPIFWLVLALLSLCVAGYALTVAVHTVGGRDFLSWFPLAAAAGLGLLGISCVSRALDFTRR